MAQLLEPDHVAAVVAGLSPLNGDDREPSGAILLMELDESVQSDIAATDGATHR